MKRAAGLLRMALLTVSAPAYKTAHCGMLRRGCYILVTCRYFAEIWV